MKIALSIVAAICVVVFLTMRPGCRIYKPVGAVPAMGSVCAD
jgi:hypothetical protein